MRALADNPYEAAARERKAAAISAHLHGLDIPAGVASALDQSGRNAACALAGQRLPISDETWARVVEFLDAFDRMPAPPADPFIGLPS